MAGTISVEFIKNAVAKNNDPNDPLEIFKITSTSGIPHMIQRYGVLAYDETSNSLVMLDTSIYGGKYELVYTPIETIDQIVLRGVPQADMPEELLSNLSDEVKIKIDQQSAVGLKPQASFDSYYGDPSINVDKNINTRR